MELQRTSLAGIGIFTAIGVGLGFSLAGVPNVEPLSAVAFVAGYLLGRSSGIVVGGLSILLFSLFNPLGPPVPGVLAAQVVAMSFIGLLGAFWRSLVAAGFKNALVAAALGAIGTLIYSLATDVALAASIGKLRHPLPIVIAGLPFSLVHTLSNGAIFFGVGLVLRRRYPPS